MRRGLPWRVQGPGIFFILPCIDTYKKVDLRTVSFDVPPQEVSIQLKARILRGVNRERFSN
jgi:regulator of protease activity HflC (stomatin/prohibitin superfamily)